jgi:hypothetical protein
MYVFDDRGEVRAYLTRTGVDLWQVQLSGTIRDVWDLGGGRLAIGGLFVLEPGGGLEAAVVLLDAATGTEVATVLGTLMALAPQGPRRC